MRVLLLMSVLVLGGCVGALERMVADVEEAKRVWEACVAEGRAGADPCLTEEVHWMVVRAKWAGTGAEPLLVPVVIVGY